MSMPERYHPECPPDAHKVIRPPVKEVFATLCVKVEDSEEKNGMANVVEILSLMSKKPLILCSDKMRKLICDYTKDSEVKPEFLRVHEDGKASISYENGAIGPTTDFYDFAGNSLNYKDFLKTLEKNGYIEIIEQKIERNPFKDREIKRDKPLPLTEEQKQALKKIDNSKFNEFLLYGVTGSGKTEVYLQLIQNALNKKKKAIVLVPEISLTPQMVDRFASRFGDCICVLHSKLSTGERNDQWKNIKDRKM